MILVLSYNLIYVRKLKRETEVNFSIVVYVSDMFFWMVYFFYCKYYCDRFFLYLFYCLKLLLVCLKFVCVDIL